jgi:hypothetical protein
VPLELRDDLRHLVGVVWVRLFGIALAHGTRIARWNPQR